MPRPPRSIAPETVHHLTDRGVNRTAIVLDDEDRRTFVRLLVAAIQRFDLGLIAFCLMDNHFHLLVKRRAGDVSAAMQFLAGTYAMKFNRRHNRTGHLFQGRFGSEPVTTDAHLIEAIRYILLNPVRAGICANPAQFRWSSYRETVGLDVRSGLLETPLLDGLLAVYGNWIWPPSELC